MLLNEICVTKVTQCHTSLFNSITRKLAVELKRTVYNPQIAKICVMKVTRCQAMPHKFRWLYHTFKACKTEKGLFKILKCYEFLDECSNLCLRGALKGESREAQS